MKRASFIRLTVLCATLCTLGTAGPFRATPVYAGHMMNDSCSDVGDSFDVNAYIDVDSSDDLYTDSYMEVQYDACDDIPEVEIDETVSGYGVTGPSYDMDGSDYAEVDPSFSASPGYEYQVEADGYAYFDYGDPEEEGGWQYEDSDFSSVVAPGPPVQLTGISPASAYAGDRLTIVLQGTCFGNEDVKADSPGITILSQVHSTIQYPGIACGNADTINMTVKIDPSQPAGVVNFIVTNNDNQTSDSIEFTVLSNSTSPPGTPPDPCAVTSNPQSGFTSIVPTVTPGGSGSMAVSFSGAAFAAISPTVNYGPYSTPSSIASNIAALITKNYFQYGLSAKAFGPNIVYSGLTTIGTVSNVATGPSFSTSASPASASVTKSLCEAGPPPPPPSLSCSTTVVRGATATCTATGGAVSDWSFTDNNGNTVTRNSIPNSSPNSPAWGGVMVASGTVSVTLAGALKTAYITVSPRTYFAFTAAPAIQQVNPYTVPCAQSLTLSVNNTPVAPPAGITATDATPYAAGKAGLCQVDNGSDTTLNSGPNTGYSYFTYAENQTLFDWVGAQDILNPSSPFYLKQCGNYNPATNVGFISGTNLLLNLIRHESSAIAGQGHYGNYVAAQNSSSLNIGTTYEQIVAFGDLFALGRLANPELMSNRNVINTATAAEPPEPDQDGFGNRLGFINYPPYAPIPGFPTCP